MKEKMKNCSAMELLETYDDLLIEFKGTFDSFKLLQADINFAVSEIQSEIERLQSNMTACTTKLKNLRFSPETRYIIDEEQDELPFNE